MKSWKTTVGAILAILALMIPQINNLLDNDPLTVFNWSSIIEAIGVLIIGLFARDKNVTSEQQGVK